MKKSISRIIGVIMLIVANGRYKALYYQHDRDDDEAICRECSQKRTEKLNGHLLI